MTTRRVHAWLADTAGCGYYRGVLPHTVLGRLDGWHTSSSTYLAPAADEVLDVLWAHRVTRAGPTARLDAILARDADRRPAVVIDVDDALDLIPETSLMPYAYYRGPTATGELDRWVDNLRKADLVTTSTLWLAEHLVANHGVDDAVVIPNTLDAAAAGEPVHPLLGAPFPITIGYQGSDTHWVDVGVVDYALRAIGKRYDHVGLQMIGHDWRRPLERESDPSWERGRFYLGKIPARWSFPDARTVHNAWLEDIVELYQVIRGFTIGLAPLADDPFNYAKSPLKILEYATLGVPWIASDVGPYKRFAAEAGSASAAGGILVGPHPNEWLNALEELINNPDRRAELAANGTAWATRWTTQTHVDGYVSIYNHLTQPGGHQ